jgi:NarL family two-component system response regulator LiaR
VVRTWFIGGAHRCGRPFLAWTGTEHGQVSRPGFVGRSGGMTTGLRIAVLTSRDLVRHGLQGMLRGLPIDVHFVDTIDGTYPADLIIVDATGTDDDSAESLEVVTDDETAPVIVLTSRPAALGFGSWEQPIHAYVTVSATSEELVEAVASALHASVVNRAARAVASPRTSNGLTAREVDVLTAIAAGKSNDEIADELHLGTNTVKTYIRTSYRKIGVQTRPRALLWALRHGLGADGVGTSKGDTDSTWEGLDPT